MDTHTSPHHIHRQKEAEDPFSTGTLRITVLLYLLIFNTCSTYDEKLGGSLAVPQQTQKDRASTWEQGHIFLVWPAARVLALLPLAPSTALQ